MHVIFLIRNWDYAASYLVHLTGNDPFLSFFLTLPLSLTMKSSKKNLWQLHGLSLCLDQVSHMGNHMLKPQIKIFVISVEPLFRFVITAQAGEDRHHITHRDNLCLTFPVDETETKKKLHLLSNRYKIRYWILCLCLIGLLAWAIENKDQVANSILKRRPYTCENLGDISYISDDSDIHCSSSVLV